MTEEVVNDVSNTPEIDYKAFYEEHKDVVADYPGIINKNKELLAEAKAAKEEKKRQEEQASKHSKEQAEKNGEFEKLWKTAKEDADRERQEKEELKKTIRTDKLSIKAKEIANELADGFNAKILERFIFDNLNNIADDVSTLSEDVLSGIKKEFETNEMYGSLLRSSKATGGGAPGNMRAVKEKEDLSKLSPLDRLMKINEKN